MDRASYGEEPDDGSAHRPLINAPPNRQSPERLEHELADGAAKCPSYSCYATFCLSLVRRDEPGPSCLELDGVLEPIVDEQPLSIDELESDADGSVKW